MRIKWDTLNNALTDTWRDNEFYLKSNSQAINIMNKLKVNGMVHRDDNIPYITWDRYNRMNDSTVQWLYDQTIKLKKIKEN